MKKIKILHVNRTDYGGSAVVVDLITKYLSKSKYEAIIHIEKPNRKRQKTILTEDIFFQENKIGTIYRIDKFIKNEQRKLNTSQRIEKIFGGNSKKSIFFNKESL